MDTSKNTKNQLGRWGEQQAADFLQKKGYQILHTNLRTPYGEIDIVAKKAEVLTFVEVKTRASQSYGNPEEAVTPSKFTHMIESAESFLQDNPDITQDWQIDVIAVRKISGKPPEINHFENAVSS